MPILVHLYGSSLSCLGLFPILPQRVYDTAMILGFPSINSQRIKHSLKKDREDTVVFLNTEHTERSGDKSKAQYDDTKRK